MFKQPTERYKIENRYKQHRKQIEKQKRKNGRAKPNILRITLCVNVLKILIKRQISRVD